MSDVKFRNCETKAQITSLGNNENSLTGSLPILVGVAEIVRAVSHEINHIGHAACDLQSALSPLARAGRSSHQVVESLQALDLITQNLFGIANFLDALAPSLLADWKTDAVAAAQVVTLSDLAGRLSCLAITMKSLAGNEAGVIDLFIGDGACN